MCDGSRDSRGARYLPAKTNPYYTAQVFHLDSTYEKYGLDEPMSIVFSTNA